MNEMNHNFPSERVITYICSSRRLTPEGNSCYLCDRPKDHSPRNRFDSAKPLQASCRLFRSWRDPDFSRVQPSPPPLGLLYT